jgi:hypothetical protein
LSSLPMHTKLLMKVSLEIEEQRGTLWPTSNGDDYD